DHISFAFFYHVQPRKIFYWFLHNGQFGQHISAEQSRGVEWVYPTIYQDDQVPYGRRTS
uniref:Uncharacterized protein n=1 Tax=Aegilops tauschii subsp. strangulata TaxID=200361 RepID=A0A453MGV3_AEGTS